MGNVTVIGAQWGDEGKENSRLVIKSRDIVFRFQGEIMQVTQLLLKRKSLSLIPSGIIRKETLSVIGNGVVVNPLALLDEIKDLKKHGVNINPKT